MLARNLKLSIILAKPKDVKVYVSSLSTLLQDYIFTDTFFGSFPSRDPSDTRNKYHGSNSNRTI
jgi:hypothetical protein